MEAGDVDRGAAGPGGLAEAVVEAEVAADVVDDVADGAGVEFGFEEGVVEAFGEFGAEGVGRVRAAGRGGVAVYGVLDGADDAAAGLGAAEIAGRGRVLAELAGEEEGAADGAGDAVEAGHVGGGGLGEGLGLDDAGELHGEGGELVGVGGVEVGRVVHCGGIREYLPKKVKRCRGA